MTEDVVKEMQNLRRMVEHIVGKGNHYLARFGAVEQSKRIRVMITSMRGAIDVVQSYAAELSEQEAAVRSEQEQQSSRVGTVVGHAWELSRNIRTAMQEILALLHDVHEILPEIEALCNTTSASSGADEAQDE